MNRRKSKSLLRSIALPLVVFGLLMVFLFTAFANAQQSSDARQYDQLQAAIDRAVVLCYAVEGRYPPSFDYLQEEYDVLVDESKYIVDYEIFASNIRPIVNILVIGGGQPA